MKPDQGHLFHAFGPYAKGYMGYSHLPGFAAGEAACPAPLTMAAAARLDCVVVPALHSQPTGMPNTTRASGCHPWLATSPDLSQVQYRYELGLGPSEAAYAQVTYARLDDHQVLVHTRFVNNTQRTLDAVLNYFLGLHYPHPRICRARLAPGVRYVPGEACRQVQFAVERPWDHQQPDAFPKGVFRDPAFTDGFGFGDRVATGHVPHLNLQPWGAQAGDSVRFDLEGAPGKSEALAIRYRTVPRKPAQRLGDFAAEALGSQEAQALETGPVSLALSGCAQGLLQLPPREELGLQLFEPGADGFTWKPGHSLQFTSQGKGSGLEIDCLLVGPREALLASAFAWEDLMPAPMDVQADENGYALFFPGPGAAYRLCPLNALTRQRLLDSGTLEDAEPMRYSNPHFTFDDLTRPFSGSFTRKHSSTGQWFNAIQPGILVPPGESRDCHALLTYQGQAQPAPPDPGASSPKDLMAHVRGLDTGRRSGEELARLTAAVKEGDSPLPRAPGEIRQAMGLLRATLLQNLVYPIYTKQGWICHFTPGKRWDNLYTWDGGFIALGLLTARRALAEYMLNLYLAPLKDPEQAFVHHGSPVPVQYMVLREMLSGQEPAEQLRLLDRYYLRTRQFYLFLSGRSHSSTTSPFKTGLLTTHDYFYSASGMDDYPPQLACHVKGLSHRVSPVITSAQAILGARTLALLASRYLDVCQDDALKAELAKHIQGYARDAAALEQALQDLAWDRDSGYFAYVLHDENGQKTGILRHEDGSNLNRGFDGIYPLVSGCGLAPHQDSLLAHLKNPGELLTPWGLTAVDQSAPYYSPEGYWNGGVWYPHAWYFGRALLDCGEGPFLLDLVQRQLTAWSLQACARWHSFEMLRVASGEGAWHFSFSGLTSPLLNWAHSLYQPGTITTGLGALLISRETDSQGSLRLRLRQQAVAPGLQLLACLDPQDAPPCQAFRYPPDSLGYQDLLIVLGPAIPPPEEAQPSPCQVQPLQPGLFLISLGQFVGQTGKGTR